MNDFLRRFKKIVAQVNDDTGVNFHRHGLRDLINDAGNDPTAARLAALAAHYFCKEGGHFNGSEPGLMVVIEFLAETSTSVPPGDPTESLVSLLRAGADVDGLTRWAAAFYIR